jgi:hypothetical protein
MHKENRKNYTQVIFYPNVYPTYIEFTDTVMRAGHYLQRILQKFMKQTYSRLSYVQMSTIQIIKLTY